MHDDELRRVYEARRAEKKVSFNRSLSFGDYFTDRWERAAFEGAGEGSSIYDNVLIIGDVQIGKNVWIGPNVVLDGSGGLKIGDHCAISAGVQIYTHDTVERATTLGRAPTRYSPTKIGDGVHIGPMVFIRAGVTIGDQCVIGAMSFVAHDILPRSIAFGSPARVTGEVTFEEELSVNPVESAT